MPTKRSITLDMTPEDFQELIESLDPQSLKSLYDSLLHARETIVGMTKAIQIEVISRVVSDDDESTDLTGVTLQ